MSLRTAIKKFSVEPDWKLTWLKVTIALALNCGFVLSWRLWVSSGLFPLSPVNDSWPAIPFPLDYIWFLLLLGLLLSVIITAQPRKPILAFLALAVLLSLWDQMRWQPWFYQYLFMLAALGFYAWKKPEIKNNQAALNSCRLIIVCTYFWSGVQKLNVNFFRETWPDMSGSLPGLLRTAVKSLPSFLILIIPLLEITIGLGLLTRKYRNVSVILVITTHIFILTLLISSGENTVVWPWNIAMVLLVSILFRQDMETSPRKILAAKNAFHALVLILFGMLPAFSLIGLWDSYLSSALYSGNTDQAVIYVSPAVIAHLPRVLHPYIRQSAEPFFLDINRWAYGELNVPVYPEPRVYKRVAEQICRSAANSSDIKLRIKEKPNPFTGLRESQYYDCNHLR
jgi:hypothetical protein